MTNAALIFTLCILSILAGVIICGICIALRECKKYRERLGEDNRDATVQTGNLILALATSSVFSGNETGASSQDGGGGGKKTGDIRQGKTSRVDSRTTNDKESNKTLNNNSHGGLRDKKYSICDEDELFSEEGSEDWRDPDVEAAVV